MITTIKIKSGKSIIFLLIGILSPDFVIISTYLNVFYLMQIDVLKLG